MRNYRELGVWEKSHKLTLELYKLSRGFPKDEIYGLTSQMRRAAVSIGANLAEGCGRRTGAELARFIRIAANSTTICCSAVISNSFQLTNTTKVQRNQYASEKCF